MNGNKWIGWLIAIVAVIVVVFVLIDSFKKKGNPDSLEKARQAKADKATLAAAGGTADESQTKTDENTG